MFVDTHGVIPFRKVLVANRGAVAARIIRALSELGIESVAVYSEADRDAPYLDQADEAHHIGPAPPAGSYLNENALLSVLRESGADGLHPGYGFLSENESFARQVTERGVRFIGPSPGWIGRMGDKSTARELVAANGLKVLDGTVTSPPDELRAQAKRLGYPLIVKPSHGGGGIGMLVVRDPDELESAIERASSLAERGFGSSAVYLEQFVERPRHVEFQLLGDRHGDLIHLFERECSVQRRHQKVIEEAPAPTIDRARARAMGDDLAAMFRRLEYDNIGTVEMLMDQRGEVSFLEMNTRLQVEHGVTEEVTGVDLVAAQVRSASGERLSDVIQEPVEVTGHAIEARVYAEDPERFLPSPGTLDVFRPPEGIRVETGYEEGQEVTAHYDPLLAKVICHAGTREAALTSLIEALKEFAIAGVKSNIDALVMVLDSEEFRNGATHTGILQDGLSNQHMERKR